MHKLTSRNLTGLGAPMGRERVTVNYVKYFHKLKNAKKFVREKYE